VITGEHEAMPEGREPPPPGWRTMAVVRWVIVAVMAVVAAASVSRGLGWFQPSKTQTSAETWYCPMHPSVVRDRPGQCPICGMDLVQGDPRSATDSGAPSMPDADVPGLAAIDLTLDRVQLIGMKTAKATREALVPELRTVGVVSAPEQGLAKITTRYAGWIERLVVAETGRKVKRGELLAAVYSPQVYLAEVEYLTARSFAPVGDSGGSTLAYDARVRLELLGVSRGEIDAIERSGKPSKAIGVYAPVGGWIVTKSAVQGMYFQAGNDLFTVADLSKVWVVADVYEHELARVKIGQAAKLAVAALPDRAFEGAVELVYPTIDTATRTAKVRLELANKELELRPGMYGAVTIALAREQVIVIPREALVDAGTIQYVFVDRGRGHFEPRRVTVGARAGEKIEIRSGVAEGELVVTTGNFLLDSESRLRAAIGGTGAAPGTSAVGADSRAATRNSTRPSTPTSTSNAAPATFSTRAWERWPTTARRRSPSLGNEPRSGRDRPARDHRRVSGPPLRVGLLGPVTPGARTRAIAPSTRRPALAPRPPNAHGPGPRRDRRARSRRARPRARVLPRGRARDGERPRPGGRR